MQNRSDYKATWQALARSPELAKRAGAFTIDEDQLAVTGAETVALLKRLVGVETKDVVLEIGCGVGRVGKVLAPFCSQWIGADISRNMLAKAKERLKGLPRQASSVLATAPAFMGQCGLPRTGDIPRGNGSSRFIRA
jgi:cyclopropane fatty-acyl-phospholipid synthase-like methyltransferase